MLELYKSPGSNLFIYLKSASLLWLLSFHDALVECILSCKWSSKFPKLTCLNTQTLPYAFEEEVIYQTPTYVEKFLSRLNRPSCLLSPHQLQWREGAAKFKASWKHSGLPQALSPAGLRQARHCLTGNMQEAAAEPGQPRKFGGHLHIVTYSSQCGCKWQ